MGGAIHVCHQGEVELERWVGGAITNRSPECTYDRDFQMRYSLVQYVRLCSSVKTSLFLSISRQQQAI